LPSDPEFRETLEKTRERNGSAACDYTGQVDINAIGIARRLAMGRNTYLMTLSFVSVFFTTALVLEVLLLRSKS
jgi:hypothetical protein